MASPIRGMLLDIEGTTSSISFVYDVMFPFARRELSPFLHHNWDCQAVVDVCEIIAQEAGHPALADWQESSPDQTAMELVEEEVIRLMDADVKATGLKALQGLIWKSGFESGEMQAHLYEEVPACIRNWKAAGSSVRIYSSGSIAAQKLFFGHTVAGDLLDLLDGHYDTTTGPKREANSYRIIAEDFGLPVEEILFLSDVVAELDAAQEAGLQTALVVRPGNPLVEPDHNHQRIDSFEQISVG